MDASSVLSDDLSDYDVISNPANRSIESSIADLSHVCTNGSGGSEPAPAQAAVDKFITVGLTAENVQSYVRKALERAALNLKTNGGLRYPSEHRTVRVYVDGSFDTFNAGHALQLRQAKLSFPSVYVMVGVLADDLLGEHGPSTSLPHIERSEVVRHCRWVDEVVQDAPWTLDEQFLLRWRIDYVAVDEGSSVDPGCGKSRLQGYDALRKLGKVIPTRRTLGLMWSAPPNPATPRSPSPEPPFESPAGAAHMDIYGIGI